jgi:hypothetical protein
VRPGRVVNAYVPSGYDGRDLKCGAIATGDTGSQTGQATSPTSAAVNDILRHLANAPGWLL